ncbi:MAG: hypothetical protein ABSA11_10195 [Candidatus Bathyarchaeia archaeon]|jgi:hypothetical protein
MIFFEILNTYFGWCPRYNSNTPQTTPNPLTSLSTIGKVAILTLLGAWGAINLYASQIQIPSNLSQVRLLLSLGLTDPQLIGYLLTLVAQAASAAILIVLLADFIVSRRILRRHRIELSALLITEAMYWLLLPVGLTNILTDWGMYVLDWWYSLGLLGIVQAIFLLYMAYKLLSNRNVLSRNMFILLSVVFVASMVLPWMIFLRPISIMRSTQQIFIFPDWENLVNIGLVTGQFLDTFVYLVAGIFCFRVYRNLRRTHSIELSLPKYVRGIIVLWALSSLGLGRFILNGNLSALFSWNIFAILNYALYLGIIVAALLPMRFKIGENVHDTPEIKVSKSRSTITSDGVQDFSLCYPASHKASNLSASTK